MTRTDLIGRGGDLERFVSAWTRGGVIAGIVGPAGVGKTRFGRELFERRAALLAAGARTATWIDLGEIETAVELHAAIASALEMPAAERRALDGAVLAAWLAERDARLLFLDDIDRLAEPVAALVAALRERASDVQIVFTSRVVPPIDDLALLDLAPLDDASRHLFLAFAGLERAALTDAQSDAVDRIVGRLDGLPLSLELAAGRLDALTLEELAARLDDVFAIVRAPDGRDDRRAGLWTTLEFSWGMLEPWQQLGLAQLARFRGAFQLGLAEAIVALPSADTSPVAPTAIDVIQAAVRHNLLGRGTTADGSGSIYRFLPTIREFAARHTDAENARATWRRYVLVLADRFDERRTEGRDPVRLARHRADLLAALESAPDDGEVAEAQARIGVSVAGFLYRSGEWAGALRILELAAERVLAVEATSAGETRRALGFRRARLLRFAAMIHTHQGRSSEAIEISARAQALCESVGDVRGAVIALLSQLGNLFDLDDLDAARALLAAVNTRLDHPDVTAQERASALGHESWLLAAEGRLDEALMAKQRAVEIHRAADSAPMVATALNVLAAFAVEAERFDRAEQVLDEFETVPGAFADEARATMHAALRQWLAFERGNLDPSDLEAQELRFAKLGVTHHTAVTSALRALCALAEGPLPAAKAALERAHQALERANAPPWPAVIALARQALATLATPDARASEVEMPPYGLHAKACRALLAVREWAAGRAPESEVERAHDALVSTGMRAVVARLRALARPGGTPWRVARDGTWFEAPEGERVEVRHRAPRRLLAALAEARDGAAPGGLDRSALFAAGWPGEEAVERAAANRVYVALSKLRGLGLGELVVSIDGAYQLAPETLIEVVDDA